MNAYYCTACRRTSYSAAEPENMIDSSCPYCGAEQEEQDETLQEQGIHRPTSVCGF